MKLSLKRLFARSMTSGPDLAYSTIPSPSPRPGRSAERRLAFVSLAGLMAVLGVAAAAYYFALRPETLRVAVGPANSDDLKVVQTLAQAFNNQRNSQIRLRAVPTDGAVASAQALAEGKADIAIIRGDLDVPKNAQAVATLRKNVAVLWVPPPPKGVRGKKAPPKITKITQLAGGRIGVIGRTQANINLLNVILKQYGVDPSKIQIIQFPANEAAEAIRNQKADAYLAAGPVNSKITTDAIIASSRDGGTPTILPIDLADAIAQNHPAYEAAEIPAGSFGAVPEEEVKTISFAHHIVARRGLSESTVSAFTRQLFAVRQTLKNEFPLAAKIETPDTDKDATIPAHPGAAAFVDGEEKTFLDRYSDFIWWGLMAVSAMGSVGAWFASYLKKDERNNNSTLRDRLLDMIALARKSEAIEELDQLQTEADGILRETLQCFEHGAIEEGALIAFNIALEQFHNAVADRRAVLVSLPQHLQRTAQLRAAGTL
jgi:TRAP transporter TAXI family solute receptor